MKAKAPTGYFQTEYGKIAYYTEGTGIDLILLHAGGHDHFDFEAILPALKNDFQVTSIDWPGHGHSEWKGQTLEYSALFFPKILTDFIKFKSPNGAILLGNSVGGYAAMKVAIDSPSLVKGLVLVDTGGMNDLDFSSKTFIKLKSSEWFTSLVWNQFPKFYIKIRNEFTDSIFNNIRLRKPLENSVAINASMWKSFLTDGYNLRESVYKIQTPTLIIWGENDPVIYPKFGVHLKERISGAKLKVLPTGHIPFAEDPDHFLMETLPFLKSIKL